MYCNLTEQELRNKGRTAIDSFEKWARRLIDEKFTEKYKENWFELKLDSGEYLVKKEIREKVNSIIASDSNRVKRKVDALFLEDIIYFLCTPKFYKSIFKEVLDFAYPQGNEEVREFLKRLIPIRNKLAHSNIVSVRDIEKAICYSNDFIEGVQLYYKSKGKEKVYNVPMIIRVMDSLGNEFNNQQISRNLTGRGHCDTRTEGNSKQSIRAGETLSIEVEIDSSFNEDSYEVLWVYDNQNKAFSGHKIVINIDENFVRVDFTFYVSVISKEHSWHRCGDVDDCIGITYEILPPIE